jgi:hypothetical protein
VTAFLRGAKPRHFGHVLELVRTLVPVIVLLKLYGVL